MYINFSQNQLATLVACLTWFSGTALAQPTQKQGIQWGACGADVNSTLSEHNSTLPVQCATLPVPLDYTSPCSNETLNLEILRLPAVKTPSRGSLFLNFGGPGANGRLDFILLGEQFQKITGGYHDVLTFVPRGTNNTLLFSCYNSTIERELATTFTGPQVVGNASDVALGALWAKAQADADTCMVAQNKTGDLIGTAFVARDMMQIVDALGEDGMLRYWGISYGTALGATVAAMFPDRVDKILLDGVVNSKQYYHDNEVEVFTDADKTFSGFCAQCASAGNRCSLRNNRTASEIESMLYSFFDDLRSNPIPVYIPGFGGIVIDYTFVRSLLASALYFPVEWPRLGDFLQGLVTGNETAILAYLAPQPSSTFSAGGGGASMGSDLDAEALMGIKCGDKIARSESLAEVLPQILARHNSSRIAGDTGDLLAMQCARWKFTAKEQYAGDFNVRTKNPIMLIGNSADPATPLVSARNMSSGFEGSVVLEQNGLGHSTIAQASLCTSRAIQAYFVNGTLPKPGTVCEVDAPIWSTDNGFAQVLSQL